MKHLSFLLLTLILAVTVSAQDTPKAKKLFKAAPDKDGVQRVEITGSEYFFEPDYIIVKVNMPVELSVKKESSIVPHDIVIKAPEAGINIQEGLSSTPKVIKFTPTKTGKYPIYCSKKFLFFKSHRDRGMEGVLEVIE